MNLQVSGFDYVELNETANAYTTISIYDLLPKFPPSNFCQWFVTVNISLRPTPFIFTTAFFFFVYFFPTRA
ncbi:hypothetical protein NDK43_06890 [Neobacillus pocheonensis]|uniref:Uncharacterized protein n=1 Tax=Neobacillus pocheonensis TaxID=363869 RepID=A0ABT0W779_9BACI|nr:hypothetical protein [Neobacillus pocheonensis]